MYVSYNDAGQFDEFYITFSPEDESTYQVFLSFSQESRWEGYSPFNPHSSAEERTREGIPVEVLLGYSEETGLREEGRRARPRDWQDERD